MEDKEDIFYREALLNWALVKTEAKSTVKIKTSIILFFGVVKQELLNKRRS